MKWRNAFYWWRDLASSSAWRLQKLIFVYERRVTFSLSSSVLCSSLCLSLVVVVFVIFLPLVQLIVCMFLWTSLFSVCASNTIDTAGFHTFFCLIFQNRMHAVRTENIFRVKIWICFRLVRFFLFSSFVLRFSSWLLRLIQYQSGYVRIEKKTYAQNHSYCSGSISAAQISLNAAPHLTTVLSMHFSAVWCWSIVGRTVQQINESLNEKWMYKSKM